MSDAAYMPRRRIETRNSSGEVISTFETHLTDAELAELDRQTAERRAAVMANLSPLNEERAAAAAEEAALAGVGIDAEAREHLRSAHQALAAAKKALARRQEVVVAAVRHVGQCQAAYDAARQVEDGIAERASAAIVQQLERGEAPKTATPTRATSERAEVAKADLEHAITARAEVAALAGQAEQVVTEAEASVKEAARGVIRQRVSELHGEIGALVAKTEAMRAEMNGLLPTLADRRWEVRWPAAAAALLTDPEAALDRLPEENAAA
jgi:hypothetical protein